MITIRPTREDEHPIVAEIINSAAQAYHGVIPADRWREPYMGLHELETEISAGVAFCAYAQDGEVIGVMGIQPVRDVDLIRHAYVRPGMQRHGVGAALLDHLRAMSPRTLLVGTWAAATWAIAFYQRHGFVLVSPGQKDALLKSYWNIPARQVEASVVLACPPRTRTT